MPPGAKKRKALKKKQQQQEAIGTSTNTKGDNLNGNDEHGSQDDRESDSTLSSPGSQGNDEFGVTSAAILSVLVVKDTAKEIPQGLGSKSVNTLLEKSPISSTDNTTQIAKYIAPHDPCVKEIAPVVDSVSNVVVSEKSEHAETSTHSDLVKHKSAKLEKDNGMVATLPASADEVTQKVESVRESEAPVSSEEKRLSLPGPQAVRTSWLSCCGLFDAVTGSDR
ncbi:unnamed protein product [Eruca vesicaria subsp. sativa]|uniref:Uncharacterized protein n=1 Tax=Eruca vesicaria subsp. sativa TaxID=29727 RepID=A0ABC8K7W0_ERUVS|nr:unnamed protein product [Eruca vesicaria subsp. sativa]